MSTAGAPPGARPQDVVGASDARRQHAGLIVGLTGGIGSGKSAVADAFAALGVEIADADVIAHALSAPGQPGHAAMVDLFGPEVIDAEGAIDRAHVRRIVFADPDARKRLEAALHPLIRAATLAQLAAWSGPYGLLVVPLLLERGGLTGVIDRVLVVDCPEALQVERVMRRSGLSEPEVRAIMATQLTRERRLAAAHDVIDNSGPASAIAPRVEALDRRYRALAARSAANMHGRE